MMKKVPLMIEMMKGETIWKMPMRIKVMTILKLNNPMKMMQLKLIQKKMLWKNKKMMNLHLL